LVNCEVQTCLLFFPTWNIAIFILCTDYVMAIQVLLWKSIEDVTPKAEFRSMRHGNAVSLACALQSFGEL